jgi:hypothetical protein
MLNNLHFLRFARIQGIAPCCLCLQHVAFVIPYITIRIQFSVGTGPFEFLHHTRSATFSLIARFNVVVSDPGTRHIGVNCTSRFQH